ncbi:MAG: VCBS repeat-containing protein, partial [Verrucomicrobiota bacterium]
MFTKNHLGPLCGCMLLAGSLLLPGCDRPIAIERGPAAHPLFTLLNEQETGIHFNNPVEDSPVVNVYFYLNAYNGGGVAIGDINNDQLPDIYLTGNLAKNKLYLNKGNLRFEDITDKAGVASGDDWCTGVTMADVNQDGLIDIYVCRAFHSEGTMRANLLFINNGDLTFTERAKEYGVADESFSTQATFFDYDLDGDLDLYVGNHSRRPTLDHDESYRNFLNPPFDLSDHLYRNNGNGTFTDVTIEAGILNFGVTLGVVAGDINQDGWPDIYIAKDQQEPDFLFLNQRNGTFRNTIHDALKHISDSSMGVDLADFNNDGHLDIAVADMMPESNYRQKTQMSVMDPKIFWTRVEHRYHYQYTRNMLQLNNGNGTFSDIAPLAGVAATDWSWSVLFADVDNDGLKDLFFTCGIKRDIQDKDYKAALNAKLKKGLYEGEFKALMDMIPATPIPNKFFRNAGNLTFSDETVDSGFGQPGFSNGAAFADLDLDGDLDFVVNNISSPVSLYRNNASQTLTNHFLRIRLKGSEKNPFALGAKVTVQSGTRQQFQELTLTRGFQSSVEPVLHFGMGELNRADEVLVEWPGGTRSRLTNVIANQVIDVSQANAPDGLSSSPRRTAEALFHEITNLAGVAFQHVENSYDDFAKEILLPYKNSERGPKLAVGDVDGNGLDDFFIGGASGQSGVLFLQSTAGRFQPVEGPWTEDSRAEDAGAVFFDADGDKDLDLYVVSGGNE